mgnify:CR=1 FL=1
MNDLGKHADLYMTVGKLRKILEDYPDDAKVYYERIEDTYFDPGKGWDENSVKRPSELSGEMDQFIAVWGRNKYPNDDNLYLTAHY